MEKFRSRDGTLIAYERTGTGEPLVLVHGSGDDHTRWTPVLPALARRFAVYAIDRRGRGESGDSPAYSLDKVVAGRGRLRLLAAIPAAQLIGVQSLHEAAVGVLILAAWLTAAAVILGLPTRTAAPAAPTSP